MTSNLDLIRGRSNIITLTNNSGGALVAGDVCIQDTSADEKVTTTTSAASLLKTFIAAEAIGIGAAGRFYSAGYCPLVTPSASVTRGRYLFTHTVAKQAAENATYGAGAFGVILTSGATPTVWLFGSTAQGSGGGVARSGATTDGHLAVWNGSSADSIKDGGVVPTGSADGWTAGTGTWSYSSADAPTFVISVNNDQTAIIGVGQKIKLTQTTAKYFIVTAVGAFSGGATLITVYGGTDYTLANAAITSPFYSTVKAPFGFPMTPGKWSVIVTDTTIRTQASPVKNTWYNLGTTACQIVAPIGVWYGAYKVALYAYRSSSVASLAQATLSTANNSESDANWTTGGYSGGGSGTLDINRDLAANGIIDVATKTTLYLNAAWDRGSVINADGTSMSFRNDLAKMVLSLTCAYL